MTQKPSLQSLTLKLFLQATLRNRKHALLSFLNPIGAMLINVGVPFYAGKALVSIGIADGQFKANMIRLCIVAVFGTLANRIGFTGLMTLQAKTMSDLGSTTFEHLLGRSIGFHTNQISGKLVSDALDFVGAYSTLIMAVFNSGVSLVAILISGLIIISVNSWQLGLFLLVTVVITIGWAYLESRVRSDLRIVRLAASKAVTGHIADSVVNAQTVKTFANEQIEISRNQSLNHKLLKLRINDWGRAGKSGSNRIGMLLALLILLLLLINHIAATDRTVLATGIFAFTYTFALIIRLFDINALTRQIEESLLQASPITNILLTPAEITDVVGAQKLQITDGKIDFNGVHFQYTDNQAEQSIFADLDLSIAPGEKIGLVGTSGGGKTTLTRLLLRFDDIQSGTISIDDQDIGHVTQNSLRKNIAYVPQEPLLFHRSIGQNIAYSKPGATQDEIVRAAKLAFADDFINSLPGAYETVVGERGVKLSGGQRQRIAIARAILKQAPILVLDEATSALDSESEKLIQAALSELMKDRTTIVIAHRLSTIQKMDRILVLENGKIIEQGTHSELLAQKGKYATLWAHQSGGFID